MIINIGWEYFLGIIVSLVGIAWYSSGRFSELETSIKWIKDNITKLEGRMDNAFASSSPIKLLQKGIEILERSELKKYIDDNKDNFIEQCCKIKNPANQYDIQEIAFKYFDELNFGEFELKIKEIAFKYGMSIETIRRIGGIYFRDILLEKYHFKPEDLDKPKTS